MTTTNEAEMTRELIQNHGQRRCPGCGRKILSSRRAYRYANGEIRHPECPAPAAAPAPAPMPAAALAQPERPAGFRQFGALCVDDSFRAWEDEYEREGR